MMMDHQVTPAAYRDAMALLGAAVSVVTTGDSTQRYGFTASAICSVTDQPPTLLVCINRHSRSHDLFIQFQRLVVNVLAGHQQPIAHAFAGVYEPEQRFDHGNWQSGVTGAPVLAEALVSFECQIDQMLTSGTHSILICPILAIHQGKQMIAPPNGLLYFNRAYHQLDGNAR